jgi:hypothetical protein
VKLRDPSDGAEHLIWATLIREADLRAGFGEAQEDARPGGITELGEKSHVRGGGRGELEADH